ncbi:uncharacterized protein LOC131212171 isoform X2 [Anopheles bellator]|nr:uncharacterized protein LOC131212171 isoform X2 [Anopheles bellator]
MGNKNELIDRLQCALLDGGDVLEDTANSEDLLEDDELNDDLLDEDKDLTDPVVEEEQILLSPTPSEKSKSASPEQTAKEPADTLHSDIKPAQRKVALKRNISITKPTLPTMDSTSASSMLSEPPKAQRKPLSMGNSASATSSGSDGEPEKKVVKLGQLTALERLEMRAKKFGSMASASTATATNSTASGSTPGENNKLEARAARFGLPSSGNSSTDSTASMEALKKRAERFGGSVSSKMTKLEQEEKLAKRQARFGATAANGSGKSDGSSSVNYAEKARQRLERFKSAA